MPSSRSRFVRISFSRPNATFFVRQRNGEKWEPFGDWNQRCARDHADLFSSAGSVLAEFVDFATNQTKARLIYNSEGLEGLAAESEEELDRITDFIRQARAGHPKLDYQRNGIYLRFCHADYHKGATLAELARLLDVARENIFAAGDHHNDVSMLDGRFAAMPSCPANAIPEVQNAVSNAGGYIAQKNHGAGVHEALLHFTNGAIVKRRSLKSPSRVTTLTSARCWIPSGPERNVRHRTFFLRGQLRQIARMTDWRSFH